jgi:hypothetical protein
VTRIARLVLAGAALVAAAFLAVLALDVGRWEQTVTRDDLRFEKTPSRFDLWRRDEILPFGVAREVLALEDDLAYRRAVRTFWRSQPRAGVQVGPKAVVLRARAQLLLERIANTDPDRRRRSDAANLLGVLSTSAQRFDVGNRGPKLLERAVTNFRNAVKLDPSNEDAKYNLELFLRAIAYDPIIGEEPTGPRHGREAPVAGISNAGTGY